MFSMVFFNLDPGTNKLTAGPQTWLFLAITIPLTIVIFSVWTIWKIWRTKAIEKDVETNVRLQDIDLEKSGGLYEETRPRGLGHSADGRESQTIPLQRTNYG